MSGDVTWHAPDEAGIARLVLCNPGKLNAMSVAMWHRLRQHVQALSALPPPALPRVVVVQGADGQFASGGDIEEFTSFRFDADTLRAFHENDVLPALRSLLDCDVPLVAAIEGACIGGGLEIAACCDLRLASPGSRFGVPIARLGFPMAPAEIEIVARAIGATVLRELLIEARVIDAPEALRRGIVSRVIDDGAFGGEVRATALRIAALSPQALRLNKQALRAFPPTAASAPEARRSHYDYADTAEHREGLAAFLERRPARF